MVKAINAKFWGMNLTWILYGKKKKYRYVYIQVVTGENPSDRFTTLKKFLRKKFFFQRILLSET